MHACKHAFTKQFRLDAREAGRRYTHPSDTLPTPLLSQYGQTPLDSDSTDEVKAAFAEHREHAVITDDNKNALLLECARMCTHMRRYAVCMYMYGM